MTDGTAGTPGEMEVQLVTPGTLLDVVRIARALEVRARPSLLINERELSVLRRGVTKDGWKRTLYLQPADECSGTYIGAGLLSTANRWLETDAVAPDWKSTDSISCCKCDGQYIIPCVDCKTCRNCPSPIGGAPSSIPAWRWQLHRLSAGALALAVVYGVERDRVYAQKAVELIMACADAYSDAGERAGAFFDPRCVVTLTQAYDLICPARCVGEEDREQLEKRFLAPLAAAFSDTNSEGPEGVWRISACGLVGLALKDHRLLVRSLESLVAWLNRLRPDGLVAGSLAEDHYESLAAVLHLTEACHRSGINLYDRSFQPGKAIRRMFTAPLGYAYPSFRLPALGNTGFDSFVPLSLYEVACRRWPDAELAWVLKKGYSFFETPLNKDQVRNAHRFVRASFYSFLFGRDLPGRSGVLSPRSKPVSSQGLACLRNSSSLMATMACRSLHPGHSDPLGFTMFVNGQLVAADYGMPAAEPGASREWHSSVWAHNTVVVDGRAHPAEEYDAEVLQCLGTEFQATRAVLRDYSPGVTHTRATSVIGDVCVLSDVLESDSEHTFDWIMKLEGVPALPQQLEPAPVPEGLHPLIETSSAVRFGKSVQVRWTLEKDALEQTLWIGPGEGTLVMATCPAESEDSRVPALISRQRGTRAEFVSVFTVSKPEESFEFTRTGGTLVLTNGTRTSYIQCSAMGEQDTSVIKTDARFAAVTTNNGAVQSVVVSGGSVLEWNGNLLVQCPGRVDCLEAIYNGHGPQIRYGGTPGMLSLQTTARVIRVNGYRAAASSTGGVARIRITPQMAGTDIRSSI